MCLYGATIFLLSQLWFVSSSKTWDDLMIDSLGPCRLEYLASDGYSTVAVWNVMFSSTVFSEKCRIPPLTHSTTCPECHRAPASARQPTEQNHAPLILQILLAAELEHCTQHPTSKTRRAHFNKKRTLYLVILPYVPWSEEGAKRVMVASALALKRDSTPIPQVAMKWWRRWEKWREKMDRPWNDDTILFEIEKLT
jgi:hypothetical protein